MNYQTKTRDDQIGMSIDDCCREGGFGKSFFYEEVNRGGLPARKIGRRTIVLRADFLSWLQSRPLIKPLAMEGRHES